MYYKWKYSISICVNNFLHIEMTYIEPVRYHVQTPRRLKISGQPQLGRSTVGWVGDVTEFDRKQKIWTWRYEENKDFPIFASHVQYRYVAKLEASYFITLLSICHSDHLL